MLPWCSAALAGFALALSYPNEVIPGWAGDHPPFLLGWIALFPFMWAIYSRPERHTLWLSWLFGFCYFMTMLSWLRLFGLLPWLGLALVLSATIPLIVFTMQSMRLPIWAEPFGLAIAWTGIEWLRSLGTFGFPWGEVGASQVDGVPFQMVSLGGVYLVSFFMIWVTGTLTLKMLRRKLPRPLLPVMVLLVLVGLLGGWWQAHRAMTRWNAQPYTHVIAIIQPNVTRGLRPSALVAPNSLDEEQRQVTNLRSTLALSRESLNTPAVQIHHLEPPLLVWPESAMRYPPDQSYDILKFCSASRCSLLAGAPGFTNPDWNLRNSAYLLGPNGNSIARYDKRHLVPFGEFVPLRGVVHWLRQYGIVPDVRSNDITPGPNWTPITINGYRVGIGICFESTFSSITRQYTAKGANYLIFISNDAWFHQTSAVRQHFNHARARALESGLPVIRSAGTGISGIVAPNGKVICEIPTYTAGFRTLRVPEGTPGTFFSQIGWLFAPLCLIAGVVLGVRGLFISYRDSSRKHT